MAASRELEFSLKEAWHELSPYVGKSDSTQEYNTITPVMVVVNRRGS